MLKPRKQRSQDLQVSLKYFIAARIKLFSLAQPPDVGLSQRKKLWPPKDGESLNFMQIKSKSLSENLGHLYDETVPYKLGAVLVKRRSLLKIYSRRPPPFK